MVLAGSEQNESSLFLRIAVSTSKLMGVFLTGCVLVFDFDVVKSRRVDGSIKDPLAETFNARNHMP